MIGGRKDGIEGREEESFFFFQAEDGIRDHCVTGVQTCALPIFFRGDRLQSENPSLFSQIH